MKKYKIGWKRKSGGLTHKGTTKFDYASVCAAINFMNAQCPNVLHFRVPDDKVSLKTIATATRRGKTRV